MLRRSGRDTIRPDQIAEPDVLRPDWPRADLNLACLELLVGLCYLACPPEGSGDRANPPNAAVLRRAMHFLAPAFELLGDGPRFLQDLAPLEQDQNAKFSPPDMLFIDSAGDSTAKKNADLMVRRGRYNTLPLPLAAIALYTLQAFAPLGGRGNYTSMRGGGPMVTLVKPAISGLWPLIWANIPKGKPLNPTRLDVLPWMRPTETSEPRGKTSPITVPRANGRSKLDPEVFFGQPRRLRLVMQDDVVVKVVQKPYGTNYFGWRHPLTPYYNKGAEIFPCHPKPGTFGYRNWRGVILQSEVGLRPVTLEEFLRDFAGRECTLIVAGWAMSNMKPLDFIWSEQPVFPLSVGQEIDVERAVEAAELAGFALAEAVRKAIGQEKKGSGSGQRALETFFISTQSPFEEMVEGMSVGMSFMPTSWLDVLRRTALRIFDVEVLPGLADLGETRRRAAVTNRSWLAGALRGESPFGKKILDPLGLAVLPKLSRRRADA